MNNEMISVIVPVYNTEDFLSECIESLLNQTYKNLEILLIDDGSTDNSGVVADSYAERDFRIKVMHIENGGASNARNVGLDKANGRWIAFVDSDDTVEQGYFEYLLNLSHQHNADIVMGISNTMYEDGSIELMSTATENVTVMKSDEAVIHLLDADIFGCGINKMYAAKICKESRFNTEIHINEDLLMNYCCFKKAAVVVASNKRIYNYRCCSNSASRVKYNKNMLDSIFVNDLIQNDCKNTNIWDHAFARYVGALVSNYRSALKYLKDDTYKELYIKLKKNNKEIIACNCIKRKKKIEIFVLLYMNSLYQVLIKK